jgi:hypothetical protein
MRVCVFYVSFLVLPRPVYPPILFVCATSPPVKVEVVDEARFLLELKAPRHPTLLQCPSRGILEQLHGHLKKKMVHVGSLCGFVLSCSFILDRCFEYLPRVVEMLLFPCVYMFTFVSVSSTFTLPVTS